MAKISALPLLANPTGLETVPVVSGATTRQAPIGGLVDAAVAPAVSRAEIAAATASTFVDGLLFTSVAAGLASVANDAHFAVAGVFPSNVYATLYRKENDAAVELESLYSKSGLDRLARGGAIRLTADLTIDEWNPREADCYILNGHTLTIGRMIDSQREGLFLGEGIVRILGGFARPEWWTIRPLRNCAQALSLGGGGRALCDKDEYEPEFTAANPLRSPLVEFVGKGSPDFGPGYTSLVGGTRFKAPFIVIANGTKVKHCGFDAGKDVCDELWDGVAQEAFNMPVEGHDGERASLFEGFEADDVSALCYSPTSPVHAFLIEGAVAPKVRNLRTVFGANGFIAKTRKGMFADIWSRGHSTSPIQIKSDIYAAAIGNTVTSPRIGCITFGDTAQIRILAATADCSGTTVIDPRAEDGCTLALSTERTNGFFVSDTTIVSLTAEATRAFGALIGGGSIGTTLIGGRVNNVLDSAGENDFGHGIDIAEGAENTSVIGFKVSVTAGHGIRNAGKGTKISGTSCIVPGDGKAGFYGMGPSDMTIAPGCAGSIGYQVAGSIRGGGRQLWAPAFNGGLVETLNGGSVNRTATYSVVDGVMFFEIVIAPSGGATVASLQGATMTGLPVNGRPGTIAAAFASANPAIASTGFTNGAGAGYLPLWAATSDTIILSGQYHID